MRIDSQCVCSRVALSSFTESLSLSLQGGGSKRDPGNEVGVAQDLRRAGSH